MKRFWTDVTIEGSGIRLDGRPVRTPARAELLLPTAALADAVAAEWRAVDRTIDPRAMPLTGFANAAIDRIAPDPAAFAATVADYAGADLLCYRAEHPAPLVARQAALWDPPLDWARARYDIAFVVTHGILHVHQPPATIDRLTAAVHALDPFRLAALSSLTALGGSLVVALALVEGALTESQAWSATELDELWQVEQWGEDATATTARADKRAAFHAAVRLLGLL